MRLLPVLLLLLVAGALAAHFVSAARFHATAARLVDRLLSGPIPVPPGLDLPPAMRSFALRGGAGEATAPRVLRITQEAEFRQGPDRPWGAMPATQHIALGEAGFVWNARQPGPILPRFTVIDSFVAGEGLLLAALFGSIRVVNATGPVADRGEAMRYLAELPWAPDAILGNPDLRWQAVSETAIEVRLDLDPEPAVVRLILTEDGDVAGVEADRPDQQADGTVIHRPWRGTFWDYGEIGGRRIPLRGEVGYLYDGVYQAYWRGRVTGYELLH